jgi:hypothetical protein
MVSPFYKNSDIASNITANNPNIAANIILPTMQNSALTYEFPHENI